MTRIAQHLMGKYPKLYSEGVIELGTDGWLDILDVLSSYLIQNPDIRVVQVKEKFGSLRFYADNTTDEEDKLIDFAEALSIKTCVGCGCSLADFRGICKRCSGRG